MEEIPETVKRVPQEHVQNYTGEQIVDVPVSQIQEKIVGVIHLILRERISKRIGAEIGSRIQEELLEVIQLSETFMDGPVSQIQERLVGGTHSTSTPTVFVQREHRNASLWKKTLCTLHLGNARDHLQALRSGRQPSRKHMLEVVLPRT